MKALEYLKREREIKKHCADVAWGYFDKDIDEAIKELEELESRTCCNCKHWDGDYCNKIGITIDIGGCGDYWEPKQ
jgi:hypothetical protein